MKKIVVKYHSEKMLLTVDLNKMFELIFNLLETKEVFFKPMTEEEKIESEERVEDLIIVRKRFLIYEHSDQEIKSCELLEKQIVDEGVK